MRRKLLLGLCLAAVVGLAAGDFVFNRTSGAQDAPKKAEPDEKKSDLFELLKKELDGKKEAGVLSPDPLSPPASLPPLPPPGGLVQTGAQEKGPLPPVVSAPTPGPLPLPQGQPEEPKPIAPQGPAIPAPTPNMPPKSVDPLPPPNPIVGPMQAPSAPPGVLQQPPALTPQAIPEKLVDPPSEGRNDTPGYPKAAFDPLSEPVKPKQVSAVKPANNANDVIPPPRTNVLPPATSPSPTVTAKSELAKTKTSPWTLHIEIVDDMTIVTATVNKKHEFKVVCQNLEVQTGKDAFKASGKVRITGDSMTGSCERLAISLTDDRLVLEGGAEVQIQKTITQVSSDDGKPAAFELKGETLNLRISELHSGKFTQASYRKLESDVFYRPGDPVTSHAPPLPAASGNKEWSPYGKLRRVDGKWRLEDNAGRVMLQLETTNGKLLETYDGRSISVFGPMVDRLTVRVTHIAVP